MTDERMVERYDYITGIFAEDWKSLEMRDHLRSLEMEFQNYVERQPEEVRDLLYTYISAFQCVNMRLFVLACQHLALPDEPKNIEK